MIRSIAKTVEALRRGGIAVSTAEAIDAAEALRAVGVESRQAVRSALRATLAKGRRERMLLDEVFDSVFAPPARGGGEGQRQGKGPAGEGGGPGGACRGSGAGRGRPRAESDFTVLPAGAPPERARGRPAGRLQRRGARQQAPRSSDGSKTWGRLRRVVRGPRERTEPKYEPAWRFAGAGGKASRSAPAPIPGGGRTRTAPERGVGEGREPEQGNLAAALTTAEERLLSEQIPRIVSEIRLRRSRRLRSAAAGRVWMRGALRENLCHGGVPFILPLRTRARRSGGVVLLVDVSWSVARAAGLFLAIVMRFLREVRGTRVVLFVDRPVDATIPIRDWLRGGGTFAAGARRGRAGRGGGEAHRGRGLRGGRGSAPSEGIVATPGGLSFHGLLEELKELDPAAPSDYGRTFHSLLQRVRLAGRDTLLVVLGDGRTNRFDPLEWAFREIADRCRTVIWIVPEPRARWGREDSALPAYLPSCDVAVEAHDLAGLARGVREILRAM